MKKILILAVCVVVCCGSIVAQKRPCYAIAKGKVPAAGSTLCIVALDGDSLLSPERPPQTMELCDFVAMVVGACKAKGYKITRDITQANFIIVIQHGVDKDADGEFFNFIQLSAYMSGGGANLENMADYVLFCATWRVEEQSSMYIRPFYSVFDRLLLGAAIEKGFFFTKPQKMQWNAEGMFMGVSDRTMRHLRRYQNKFGFLWYYK